MPPRRIHVAALAPALLILLWPIPAHPTSVESLDAAALVSRAVTIAWVDCVSVSPEWDAGGTRIFTRARFSPREVLKGDPQLSSLELCLPGGELDGKAYVVHGMPRFQPGQELVLCVSAVHPGSGVCVPVGLSQGVWRVLRAAGKPGMARRDTRELQLLAPGVRGGQPGSVEELPLEELLQQLRSEVRRQAQGRR